MNYFAEEFIQVDKRKWNDILACLYVDKYSLYWKISKRLTALVRHRRSSSLEFFVSADFQWLGYIYIRSNKPTFHSCEHSNMFH